MSRRSRLAMVAMAVVMAMLLSSCWQIRRIAANLWVITPADTANVTVDLYPAANVTADAYPIMIVGIDTGLDSAGKLWDTLDNYGGKEPGVNDGTVRNALLNNDWCQIGDQTLQDVKSNVATWRVFRTTATVDMTGATDPLRYKQRFKLNGDAITEIPIAFVMISGMWNDDGDMIPEDGEFYCQSLMQNTLLPNIP